MKNSTFNWVRLLGIGQYQEAILNFLINGKLQLAELNPVLPKDEIQNINDAYLKKLNASTYTREGEYPNGSTTGEMIFRGNAEKQRVHGAIGEKKSGYVQYDNVFELNTPQTVVLNIRYSKHSEPTNSIDVFLDNEPEPRASFTPAVTGDWNDFILSKNITLGNVGKGNHSIRFLFKQQEYGVMDLDQLIFTLIRN